MLNLRCGQPSAAEQRLVLLLDTGSLPAAVWGKEEGEGQFLVCAAPLGEVRGQLLAVWQLLRQERSVAQLPHLVEFSAVRFQRFARRKGDSGACTAWASSTEVRSGAAGPGVAGDGGRCWQAWWRRHEGSTVVRCLGRCTVTGRARRDMPVFVGGEIFKGLGRERFSGGSGVKSTLGKVLSLAREVCIGEAWLSAPLTLGRGPDQVWLFSRQTESGVVLVRRTGNGLVIIVRGFCFRELGKFCVLLDVEMPESTEDCRGAARSRGVVAARSARRRGKREPRRHERVRCDLSLDTC